MCEPISDPMSDVVVDFLMSKWSNIHIDYEGSLVLVRLPGTLFKLSIVTGKQIGRAHV